MGMSAPGWYGPMPEHLLPLLITPLLCREAAAATAGRMPGRPLPVTAGRGGGRWERLGPAREAAPLVSAPWSEGPPLGLIYEGRQGQWKCWVVRG